MTRRTSKTVTETITCDICGKTWDEEVHGFNRNNPSQDDLCDDCQGAYNSWKVQRKKDSYKIAE